MRAMQLLYRPVQGGMETLAASLNDSLQEAGIEMFTHTLENSLSGASSMWSRTRKASHLIRISEPDVILAHSTIPNFYARLATSVDVPVICVLHSANDEWNNPKLRAAELLLQRRTSAVVAVSTKKRDEYVRRFPRSSRKIHVIPNGINAPAPSVAERPTIPQLLFAGRVTPQKNLMPLLEACLELKNRGFKFKLSVAGQEPDEVYSRQVRSFISGHGMNDVVHMLGVRSDIPALMARADLLVHPSLAEAHSLTLLEAAAQGLPAIVTRYVHPTLDRRMVVSVFDGETVGDLVHQLSVALADLDRLRAEAREVAHGLFRDYSIESTTSKYLKLLKDVAAKSRHKSGY